jgi:hypothetical protein
MLGINRTGDFRKGNLVTLPKNFGTPINTTTHEFGNSVPTSGDEQNIVTWTPSPEHFGNPITDGD